MNLFFVICGALISVMNPLGTAPIYVVLTKEHTIFETKRFLFELLSMFMAYY